MQEFSKFLVDNWRIILDIVVLISSIIFFILKKKPLKVVDSVKSIIIEALPTIINRVENYKDIFDPSRKLSGEEKLQMVVHSCQSIMVDECGIKEEDLCFYTSNLIQWIEDILSTPQKKGEKDG